MTNVTPEAIAQRPIVVPPQRPGRLSAWIDEKITIQPHPTLVDALDDDLAATEPAEPEPADPAPADPAPSEPDGAR